MKKVVEKNLENKWLLKITKLVKKVEQLRESYLEKRVLEFKDSYMVKYHQEPNEAQIRKVRKDSIKRLGIIGVVLVFVIFHFIGKIL